MPLERHPTDPDKLVFRANKFVQMFTQEQLDAAVAAEREASDLKADRAYLNGLRSGFTMGIENAEAAFRKSEESYAAAIEQAEKQEPVECMCGICKLKKREWVGLTDEDKEELQDSWVSDQSGEPICYWPDDLIEATEAKLKQKNGYAEEKNT